MVHKKKVSNDYAPIMFQILALKFSSVKGFSLKTSIDHSIDRCTSCLFWKAQKLGEEETQEQGYASPLMADEERKKI